MQEMKYISDRWYSTKEICAYLGVSRDTLLVWSNEKDMPTSKVGRSWKFKFGEVDEWIKSGKATDNRSYKSEENGS